MLLPAPRVHAGSGTGFLHDHTADVDRQGARRAAPRQRDVRALPPRLGPRLRRRVDRVRHDGDRGSAAPIADVRWRDIATIEGTVRSVRARPWGDGVATLECTVLDASGGIEVVFLGAARAIPGIGVGTRIPPTVASGAYHRRLAILNPVYELWPTDGRGGHRAGR